jgi:glycyl-tRNA synthetase beta chain
MTDFLLELLSEEIPARMQAKAKEDLARLFTDALAKAGLAAGGIETFATPRRLALIAKGLPLETEPVAEETKGPKVGAPPQAMEGFLRKVGLTQDQLVERGGVFFAVVNKPGRKTADVLAEAIPAIIRAFPWPKSMRWGAASLSTESLRWVRPLQGIVALLGDDIVPCEVEGISSGRETMGHRFHSSSPISIANADGYVETLRAAHVIVHFSERCRIIRDGAAKAAADAGLVLVEDEGLVAENAGLTEWPVPMLGRFDPAFLAVPEEVIQLTARVNQKYFICRTPSNPPRSGEDLGRLANAFVCTANIIAKDGGAAIVAGNEKVLAARLSDAKFFWEQDLKVRLDDQAAKLSNIVFHEKLGTVADKVERVAKLARWLVESGVVNPSPPSGGEGQTERSEVRERGESVSDQTPPSPSLAALAYPSPPEGGEGSLATLAERAARLCKADLVTGMVGEFPELQGIMGGYYARAQGESDAVADAIRDHYKPVGQGDDVPTAPVTVAVSLADKLDTLSAFFAIEEKPTGSKDPFALRRAAISVIRLISENEIRLNFQAFALDQANMLCAHVPIDTDIEHRRNTLDWLESFADIKIRAGYSDYNLYELRGQVDAPIDLGYMYDLLVFFADRLKVQQREAGVRHDLIDAVFALGGEDDLVRLLARVKALQGFITTDEGANLLAGYKRAANILKQNPSPPSGGEGKTARSDVRERGESASGQTPPSPSLAALAYPSPPEGGEGSGVETALLTALNTAEPRATAAIAAEDFEAAMAALASLRSPIDAFFDGVMVNDPDPQKRAYRLGLLARFRDAVHAVADFSKIEG